MNPVKTAFDVNRLLARQVRAALDDEKFPLVLAGNCNHCVGTIAGIQRADLGVVWFDAHGNFNTPETSTSGYLDGMALALTAGDCWQGLLDTIPGFIPVAGNRMVHIGARDLDAREVARFSDCGASLVDPAALQALGVRRGLEPALRRLRRHTDRVYVHVDMDIVEPGEARSKAFAPDGGLTVAQVVAALQAIGETFTIQAAAIAACDPDADRQGRAISAGMTFAQALAPETG
ncbi:arginase family protein [Desulfosarcina alkanivorans]|nr:arginase family protein [Desulfosarcina alkanivorans]